MFVPQNQVMSMKDYYFLIFFAPGSLFPLLSTYLREEIHLTDAQIGIVMSISPIFSIFLQPIWGIVSDYTQKPRTILTITLLASSIAGMVYAISTTYWMVILAAIVLIIPFSASTPISDSITVNFTRNNHLHYGSFRLWGALGYAVASFIMGELSIYYFSIIFYGFTIIIAIAGLFSMYLPNEQEPSKIHIKHELTKMMKYPKFILFLTATFLTFGPMDANNTYLGLFI